MAKKKSSSKKHSEESVNLDFTFIPGAKFLIFIYAAIAFAALGLSYYYINFANMVNHYFSFPLDDPWIHLTFARNLIDYHSFSYFKSEMITAGSTSPIYTFVLSAVYLIIKNEFILSYVLGILFLISSAIFFYKLSSFEFSNENIYAFMLTGIFVADKWLNFIAVSGMETTMFVFILIGCVYFYKQRKAIPFAIFLGLILWGRPDGLVFIAALAVDYIFAKSFSMQNKNLKLFSKNEFLKIGIIAGGIIAVYFGLNLFLSGSLLPNTFNAKLAYYDPEFRSRISFLRYEVWEYFTNGAYGIMAVGFFFSVIKMLYDIFRKQYNRNIVYIIFIFALIFIYWYKLPYAHRFGRYLMPAIPFIILVSGLGFRDAAKMIGEYFKNRKFANLAMLAISSVILIFSLKNYNENKTNYAEQCAYIHDRHIVTANWIKENTNPEDLIATHDVGAIGFYCGRKIVDVAGLITPELIGKINDKDYAAYMTAFLKKSGAKYLAFQREWYRVVNQNPLYTSVNKEPIETIDVFRFEPDKTHIINREANSLIMNAMNLLAQRTPRQALQYLTQALKVDPQCSFTYFLIANAYVSLNDKVNFEKNLIKALEIFPDYKDALLLLGSYYKQSDRNGEAKIYLDKYLKISPDDKKALELYKSLPDTTGKK